MDARLLDTDRLKNIQRKATRIKVLENMTYKERLKERGSVFFGKKKTEEECSKSSNVLNKTCYKKKNIKQTLVRTLVWPRHTQS